MSIFGYLIELLAKIISKEEITNFFPYQVSLFDDNMMIIIAVNRDIPPKRYPIVISSDNSHAPNTIAPIGSPNINMDWRYDSTLKELDNMTKP